VPALNLRFEYFKVLEDGKLNMLVHGLSEHSLAINVLLIALAGLLFFLDHLQARNP
jgi:hypothetical protein